MPKNIKIIPTEERDSKSGLFSSLVENETPILEVTKLSKEEKVAKIIAESDYISRDLSWLKFNERVLDQAENPELLFGERLKFMAITASNLDEFITIRLGSLYN